MYLHLGNNIIVRFCDIVGIFDLDRSTVSKTCRKYLSNKENNSKIIYINQKLPKSFVVCMQNGKEKIYISQLTSETLFKRIKSIKSIRSRKVPL